ncbi:hypothetical protein ACA910_003798 [Epithemia clementina (nom. ined.)]
MKQDDDKNESLEQMQKKLASCIHDSKNTWLLGSAIPRAASIISCAHIIAMSSVHERAAAKVADAGKASAKEVADAGKASAKEVADAAKASAKEVADAAKASAKEVADAAKVSASILGLATLAAAVVASRGRQAPSITYCGRPAPLTRGRGRVPRPFN